MALLGTYRINATDIVSSQSGNGIIALYNNIGSGKRIYIKSVEIQNLRRDSIGANTRVADIKILRTTAQTSGNAITPLKLDTDATDFPSAIKVYKGGNPAIETHSIPISTTGNLSFAIGPPGTITRTSGSWITDGIKQGSIVTITGSASNNNTFRVRSTTATVITVETQQAVVTEAAVAATATAVEEELLGRFTLRHSFFAATTNAFFNNFNLGDKEKNFGSVYNDVLNKGGTIEPIWLAAGEGLSLTLNNTFDLDAATDVKENHIYLLECLVSVDWSPDKTYAISEYVTYEGEGSSIFSIMNETGSGRNIKIHDITVSEIGDTSTPYFMVVPFDSIESLAAADTSRDLSYMKLDTTSIDIDSFVKIKKDVSLYPKGFSTGSALFPLSFGSSVPANGLNYFITKDFLGPIYGSFFPEKSNFAANPTTAITNNFKTISSIDEAVFRSNDLFLSEGEGLAIVAAAEALTLAAGVAQQVNKFSTGKYDYSINFSVEDIPVTIALTAKDVFGDAVENVRVLMLADTGGDLPSNVTVTITRSGSVATVSHTSHGLSTGDKVQIKSANEFEYNGIYTITKIDSNSYSYTVSGRNPSSPLPSTSRMKSASQNRPQCLHKKRH
jgi:hypothetical protein